MSVIQLDLSRQKLYMPPDEPLPEFYPPPRAVLVTPIYDEHYHGDSSGRYDDHAYPLPVHTRHESESSDDPDHSRDSDSLSSTRYRTRRRHSSDYYGSPDNGHFRDDDSFSDYSRDSDDDYDYPPQHGYSPYYDRDSYRDYPPQHDRPSYYHHPPSDYEHRIRSQHHDERGLTRSNRPLTHHDERNLTRSNRPLTHHDERNLTRSNRALTHHRPEKRTHTSNEPSHQQNNIQRKQQTASRDPFTHLRSLPADIQKVLKALPPPSPHFCWSECTGNRKAVCVGVNYVGQKNALKGCANDARHIRSFLMKYYGFKSQNVLLLTDDGQPASMEPTRKNMFDAMNWLVKDAKKHDSLFFHYSGHGGQVEDESGKEADGKDEVIFPADFKSTSHIVDDDLFKALVAPLPAGCRLTALFDSCHSGTVLDLPYLHSAHGRLRNLGHISRRALKRDVAPCADVICYAACKDDETSADTFQGGVAVGAMSWAFLKILKANKHQTYAQILQQLRAILIPKYSQKAQISGTHPVDMDREFTL